MRRKLVAYTFSLAGMLGAATVATVLRYQTAQLRSGPAADPLLAPAGPLFADAATASFALVEPRRARSRAAACLRRQIPRREPALALDGSADASIAVTEPPLAAVTKELRFLRGSSAVDTSALRGARHATVMTVRLTPPGLAALEASGRVLLDCAREAGALVADVATGELFTADRWEELRVRSWAGSLPHVASHLSLATTKRADGLVEVTTVGLEKFGLPELYARVSVRALEPALGRLLGLTAQVMLEAGGLVEPGRLTLARAGVRHPAVRAALDAAPAGVALGRTEVILRLSPDEVPAPPRARSNVAIAAAEGRRPERGRRLEVVLGDGADLQALLLDELLGSTYLPGGLEHGEQALGMRWGATPGP